VGWLVENLLSTDCSGPNACPAQSWREKLGDVDAKVVSALREAVSWCRMTFGQDAAHWRWGAAHTAQYAHPNPSVGLTLVCSPDGKRSR
jgi:acyl-homoserine lactone acylase PvdQ